MKQVDQMFRILARKDALDDEGVEFAGEAEHVASKPEADHAVAPWDILNVHKANMKTWIENIKPSDFDLAPYSTTDNLIEAVYNYDDDEHNQRKAIRILRNLISGARL